MITVGDLREIFDGCWFKIITNTEDGEEVVIFDQEREKYNNMQVGFNNNE